MVYLRSEKFLRGYRKNYSGIIIDDSNFSVFESFPSSSTFFDLKQMKRIKKNKTIKLDK